MIQRALRVLIVEDDPDLVLIMRHELSLAGHEVLVATTAEQAMAHAPNADLVLLDFHLPGADGLEVLRQIQQMPVPPSVVMVTGDDLGGLDQEAMRAGAVDFVPKRPGYLRALPGIVQRAARQHDLGRRVADLQVVALSLLSADSREEAINEILLGATRLLRGRHVALLSVAPDDGASLGVRREIAQLGGARGLLDMVSAMPSRELPGPGLALSVGDALIVALPGGTGDTALFLLVGEVAGWVESVDERRLAEAYARVAASALQAARRRRHQVDLLRALKAGALERKQVHDRTCGVVLEHLARANEQLSGALERLDADPSMVRSLARAEAHVQAAQQAAASLKEALGGG